MGRFREHVAKFPEPQSPLGRARVVSPHAAISYLDHKYPKNDLVNLAGSSRKSLHVSVRHSLAKLRTDYLDWSVSMEELMDSLDAMVKAGKVLYLGASDLPAWFIAGCNSYASRDIERELLPMARHYDMAIVPWSALASGRLQSEKQGFGAKHHSEVESRMIQVLTDIAIARGLGDESVSPVALAYLFTKYPRTFPIVAFHTLDQLNDNIRGIDLLLTDDEMERIESE
ncbi:hypothetical protein IAU60_005886 [Kwoniella sp. DSM 27419]